MRRWLTIALGSLVLSCQGPTAAMAKQGAEYAATMGYRDRLELNSDETHPNPVVATYDPRLNQEG